MHVRHGPSRSRRGRLLAFCMSGRCSSCGCGCNSARGRVAGGGLTWQLLQGAVAEEGMQCVGRRLRGCGRQLRQPCTRGLLQLHLHARACTPPRTLDINIRDLSGLFVGCSIDKSHRACKHLAKLATVPHSSKANNGRKTISLCLPQVLVQFVRLVSQSELGQPPSGRLGSPDLQGTRVKCTRQATPCRHGTLKM